jgi:hypothetical protein
MSLARGTLVIVDLEPTLGHEQRGTRPCLVVSDPAVNDSQRFPLLAVVPITGTPAPGALYPPPGPGRPWPHQALLCLGGSAALDRQAAHPPPARPGE